MLKLITSESLKQAREEILETVANMTFKVRVHPTLLPYTRPAYDLKDSKEFSITGKDTAYNYIAGTLVDQLLTSPILSGIRPEYMAAFFGMSLIFEKKTIRDFSRAEKPIVFPNVEWQVEQNGEVLASSDVYSFIGSDLSYAKIENMGYQRTGRSAAVLHETDAFINMQGIRLPAPTKSRQVLVKETPDNDKGYVQLYARVISDGLRLAQFYSISDRLLRVPVIESYVDTSSEIGAGSLERLFNFDYQSGTVAIKNPALLPSEDLMTAVFLTDLSRTPKFSLLGLPYERKTPGIHI